MINKLALLFVAAAGVASALGEVKPNALFSDNAVLQQGMEVPVWGTARDGENVSVEFGDQKVSTTAQDGKWRVILKNLKAGGPFTLTITGDNVVTAKNVLVGEVWLCSGQSNMARTLVPPESVQPRQPYWEESAAAANHPEIRHFRVGGGALDEPASEVIGSWEVCTPETARGFTAVGYFFAVDLLEARKVPVGLVNASVGATGAASWMSLEALGSKPQIKSILERQERARQEYPAALEKYKTSEAQLLADFAAATAKAETENQPMPRKPEPPRNPFTDAYRPAGYYNSKIAPLPPLALRGVLWYQGESNSGQSREYGTLFPTLIEDWRRAWKRDDLPFLFVQLPPYAKTPPEMREVQLQTMQKTPHTAMIVTTDCGDPADVHPPDKRPVGARLALAARGAVYGEQIEFSGPLFESMEVEGNRAVLSFTHIGGGLVAKGGELKGFEIAGPDKKTFLPAKAEIQGNTVVVSNDQVPQPTAVRFAWANVPEVNFYNKEGLQLRRFAPNQNKHPMKTTCYITLSLIALAVHASAEVKPNGLFTDGAVLQQGIAIPVWGTARDGEKVTVQFEGESADTVAKQGKWMVRLKPRKAGGPFILTVTGDNAVTVKDVLVGEVWVCSGQSNMAFSLDGAANGKAEAASADYPQLRKFTVPAKMAVEPQTDVLGKWISCTPETARSFSAVGYFFGRDIHKATGVPVGLIHTFWSGTPAQSWTSLSALESEPELAAYVQAIQQITAAYPEASASHPQQVAEYQAKLKEWNESAEAKAYNEALKAWTEGNAQAKAEGKPELPKPEPAVAKPQQPRPPEGGSGTPTVLFNGMVAPLIPYAIKGVIWYQGESNSGKAMEYRTLFPRMIADWRERWAGGDFPFLFVQITPHKGMSPEIREAQLLTWQKTPNTGMAVTTDVGDASDIHPKQKEPVGSRLALAARAIAYGEKLEYSGPIFDQMKIDGNRAVLSFKHVGGGLVAKDGELRGFEIAGPDQTTFLPAKAEIQGETVVVSNDQVAEPAAVRFGWANVPDVNFFNQEGLPASPFRTNAN